MAATAESAAPLARSALDRAQYFIGPIADSLLLGGGSILALALVVIFWPQGSDTATLASAMFLVAHAINHPHFAHSYQLFYRDFHGKAFGNVLPPGLRARYLFAALVAPALLIGFFWYAIASGNALVLGFGANAMAFLVGWHYVKQGYGLLIVDSVLKRNFLDTRTKHVLLINAYAVWATSWLQANRAFAKSDYWGIATYTFAVPDWLFWLSVSITAVTTLAAAWVLIAGPIRKGPAGRIPYGGLIAYITSLYLWILATHPALWLVIPAFHSLQYLVVVWRYRFNMERRRDSIFAALLPGRSAWVGFALFCFTGAVMGYIGFWLAPDWLDRNVPYSRNAFGTSLFYFVCWIFINVHHYCLDNVMWRKDNPDTKRHLFGAA